MTDDERDAAFAMFKVYFATGIPHNGALGIEVVDLLPENPETGDGPAIRVRLPYKPELVGDPRTGVLHGGVITSLMDATLGAAVFMRRRSPSPIATLDLRIDYLAPATPDRDVIAEARCYKLTRNVAFVRGIAFHDAPADAIAAAVGTFVIRQRRRRGGEGGG